NQPCCPVNEVLFATFPGGIWVLAVVSRLLRARRPSTSRFPLKDSKRLLQWLEAVQRDNWTPTKYSFLCSEHFTKDSFSKRLEDQHRLLKPTAVPSIFPWPEKKQSGRGHGRGRRREASRPPGDVSEAPKDEAGSPPSCPEEALGPMERASVPAEAAGSPEGAPGRTPEGRPDERSGVSVEDFSPPGSGACKFIGSLHSYSFSSRHTRERPSLPREPPDRKRPRRDGSAGAGPCSSLPA
ncbi:peroxynitrite isomerase THAP4-like, partial [Gracilinanus agilis]|uniref:peroxynitrite isomerase THAP4-like n=1 Tax=Gracilinanus agilis TaxID=191870 RepID=UPI001CFCCF6F